MKTDGRGQRARRNIMRSAERGKEIVECLFVRQIDNFQAGAPLIPVGIKQVVISQGDVEQVARLNSLRIVVVIFRPGQRHFDVYGFKPCRIARGESRSRAGWEQQACHCK